MKNILPKSLLLGLFFLNVPTSILAESVKDNIRFSLSATTGREVSLNCGNFSYPGRMNPLKREVVYTVKPAGLVWNPRQLSYYCYVATPGFSEKQIATIGPSDFDSSKANSDVVLTIHHVDRKTKCGRSDSKKPQALIMFSISVDGQLIHNRSHACLF